MTKQQYQNWIRNIECNECGCSDYIDWIVSPVAKVDMQPHSKRSKNEKV